MPERDEILVRAFSHIFLLRFCQEGLPVGELALRTENPLGFWDINGWTCCQEGSCLEFQSPRRPWTQLIHYFRSASAQWSSREVVNDCLKLPIPSGGHCLHWNIQDRRSQTRKVWKHSDGEGPCRPGQEQLSCSLISVPFLPKAPRLLQTLRWDS